MTALHAGDVSEPTVERPTHRRYVVMAFLCALSFLTYFDRVCITRAQEDIQKDLHISDDQMGLIFGAFWLAYSLFDPLAGWMGDRYGARLALLRVVLFWSLFTVLSGAATGFLSLLVYRFLFGVGEAGAYPNMARIQERWLPASARARAGGLLWLFARFGGAFSPLLFGALLTVFDSAAFQRLSSSLGLPSAVPGWRIGFWVAGLAGAAWCLAFIPWFRNDPAERRSVNAAELRLIRKGRGHDPQSHTMPSDLWRSLLSCRSLWALGLLYFCGSFGWSFFVSWLPRYLKEAHGVAFEKSEVISGLPLFCGGITCLVGGVVCDALVRRTGRKRLSRAVLPVCGYLTAAASIWALRYAETTAEATVLMCLAAGAYDFGQGANWATIVDIGGRYAGIATGLVNLVGNMGNAFSPYVAPKIFNPAGGGWDTLLTCYACAYLAAASMWFFIDPTRTFYRESPAPA